MNIVQLLDEVGHTKLRFQMLHDCVQGATTRGTRGRRFTEVRFATTEMTPSDLVVAPQRIGVVVWMDREDYLRAMDTDAAKENAA